MEYRLGRMFKNIIGAAEPPKQPTSEAVYELVRQAKTYDELGALDHKYRDSMGIAFALAIINQANNIRFAQLEERAKALEDKLSEK